MPTIKPTPIVKKAQTKWVATQSTIKPAWYWIRNIKDTVATIRVRSNLKQITVWDDYDKKISHTEWQYDEEEVVKNIPKPNIPQKDIDQKLKERYWYADAIVVLSRVNTTTNTDVNSIRETTYTELKVTSDKWIAATAQQVEP